MLEYLYLSIGGFFGGHELFLMHNQSGILKIETLYISERSYPDCKRRTVRRSLVMTKERSTRWLQKFEQVHFENWADEYWGNGILDGTQWSMDYKKLGQEKRRCCGSNEYPENWSSFISSINKITSKMSVVAANDNSENDIEEFYRLYAQVENYFRIKDRG